MRQVNYFRLFAIAAYVVLAAFSCKWTAESLYLSMPSFGLWAAWALAIIIFVVSSIIFSQFLLSLDSREDFYGRPLGRFGTFALSLVGLIVVWVGFSVSTNSHSLIHNDEVRKVLVQDLSTTNKYLSSLTGQNKKVEEIKALYGDYYRKLELLSQKLRDEYNNPGRRGYADSCKKYRREIENMLGWALNDTSRARLIDPGRAGSSEAMDYISNQIADKVRIIRTHEQREIEAVYTNIDQAKISDEIANINNAINDVNRMEGISFKIIESAEKHLEKGYARVKNNSQYVIFDTPEHLARYTADQPQSQYARLKSVKEVVWNGVLHGQYREMYYWILIAILVDVAGFIFFSIAFRKSN